MSNVAIFKGKLVKFLAKAGLLVPARGDVDRSVTPAAGEMAFNTTANKLEVYNGTAWDQLAAGGVVSTKTSSYTLQATDSGSTIVMNNPLSSSITIPSGLDSNFSCQILRVNSPVKIVGSGTIVNSSTNGTIVNISQGLSQIRAYSSNTYNISGNLNEIAYGLTFNLSVRDQAISGDYVFLVGDFTTVTDKLGNIYSRQGIVKINYVTGEIDSVFDTSIGFNAVDFTQSKSIVISGNDIYVAGDFTTYKGVARERIAKLNSTTAALDVTFDTSTGFNDAVRSMVLSGNDLYVCGNFTTYKGVTRQRIAKINATTGTLDAVFDTTSGFSFDVYTILLSGTDIYAGGLFITYKGTSRPRIAKISAIDASLNTVFLPGTGFNNTVVSLLLSGSQLYAGGEFTTYRGSTYQYLIKLSLVDASPDLTFDTVSGLNGPIYRMLLNNNDLYVGGNFTTYKGITRQNITKINATSAALDTVFDSTVGLNSYVFSFLLNQNQLYVGGQFTNYKGYTAFNRWGKLDPSYGRIPNEFVYLNGYSFNNTILCQAISGNFIYLGGNFTTVVDKSGTLYTRQRIVKIDLTTGLVDTSFDSASGFDNIVQDIIISGNSLYVGGFFTTYKGITRQRIAKVDATTGSLDTTFDTASGFSSGSVYQMAISSNDLYVGGEFSSYKGNSRRNVVKLNATDASLNLTFDNSTGFTSGDVRGLLLSGSSLYLGGTFSAYKGTTRQNIVKIDATTAALDTTFDASTGFNNVVTKIALSGSSLYVVGGFTAYKATNRQYLAKISAVDASLDVTFDTTTAFSGSTKAIIVSGSSVYVGGGFSTYKGTTRQNIVKIDASTAALDTAFDTAYGFPGGVESLSLISNNLYVTGSFINYRGVSNANRVCTIDSTNAALKDITTL
jgi:small basic protein